MVRIGTDIVEIDRISGWVDDHAALDLVFTEGERENFLCRRNPSRHLAAAFAVKEALMKALGTGWGCGVQWRDIEVLSDHAGISVNLRNRAKELCGGRRVSASAGWAGASAVALVVIHPDA